MSDFEISPSPKSSILSGTGKTLLAGVPIVGGSLATAWSEYETHKTNKRVKEYFCNFNEIIANFESLHQDLEERVQSMEDSAELMERSIELATREVNAHKRAIFPKVYTNLILNSEDTTPEARMNALYNLEHLNMSDLQLLGKFLISPQRGDMLTGTGNPGFSPIGEPHSLERNWMVLHSGLLQSISKLTSRGLITEGGINASMVYAGDSSSEFNRFRSKSWKITKAGVDVCHSIEISTD